MIFTWRIILLRVGWVMRGATGQYGQMDLHFTEIMEQLARAVEILSVAVLVVGLIWAAVLSIRVWQKSGGKEAYGSLRRSIGGVLLLGIEVLVAADLIRTVAVEPTVENVLVLGLIVIIRTVLSFSLEIEIEGMAPWRRAAMTGATHIAAAARAGRASDPQGKTH
jgi:uncharacterized membrane protein